MTRHPGGRPRRALDELRVWSLYASWRAGRLSLSACAKNLGVDREVLRFRWAEVDDEHALWRERRLEKLRARAK